MIKKRQVYTETNLTSQSGRNIKKKKISKKTVQGKKHSGSSVCEGILGLWETFGCLQDKENLTGQYAPVNISNIRKLFRIILKMF